MSNADPSNLILSGSNCTLPQGVPTPTKSSSSQNPKKTNNGDPFLNFGVTLLPSFVYLIPLVFLLFKWIYYYKRKAAAPVGGSKFLEVCVGTL